VNHETPKEFLAYLQSLEISYVIAGESTTSLPIALEKLKALFGIEKLLLEGGGSFNGSMMAGGLVDEISLLLLPRVLNKKDAPSLFDATPTEIKTTDYSLDSCTTLEKGVLWLRYIRK
jgi:riboflavin biosynthesis pyrimidine reductase